MLLLGDVQCFWLYTHYNSHCRHLGYTKGSAGVQGSHGENSFAGLYFLLCLNGVCVQLLKGVFGVHSMNELDFSYIDAFKLSQLFFKYLLPVYIQY